MRQRSVVSRSAVPRQDGISTTIAAGLAEMSQTSDVLLESQPVAGDGQSSGCPKLRLEIDDMCDSRKFVSKHLYPVTGN
jgi:hypothetical protein